MRKNPSTRLFPLVITIVLSSFFITSTASAAAFVKFDGIDGESTDANHIGWSDLLSIAETISRPDAGVTGQSRRRGAAVFEDVVLVKEIDKTSVKLREKLARGEVIPKVEIELTATFGGARATYFKYELTNVQVTSFTMSVSGSDGDVPVEELSLNFEEIKWIYIQFDNTGASQGNFEAEWNVEEGR